MRNYEMVNCPTPECRESLFKIMSLLEEPGCGNLFISGITRIGFSKKRNSAEVELFTMIPQMVGRECVVNTLKNVIGSRAVRYRLFKRNNYVVVLSIDHDAEGFNEFRNFGICDGIHAARLNTFVSFDFAKHCYALNNGRAIAVPNFVNAYLTEERIPVGPMSFAGKDTYLLLRGKNEEEVISVRSIFGDPLAMEKLYKLNSVKLYKNEIIRMLMSGKRSLPSINDSLATYSIAIDWDKMACFSRSELVAEIKRQFPKFSITADDDTVNISLDIYGSISEDTL